jgi:hypothetical protein
MWSQIAGKICLRLTPRVNHFWNIAFQVTPRGLTTLPMPYDARTFTLTFDFVAHELAIDTSAGERRAVALRAETVAAFYARLMDALKGLGITVRIWTMPVEVPDPIRFEQDDVHRSYDPAAAQTFWQILLAIKPILESFRSEFIGKCSPVHFFWGSFDLAVTRFNGERAPERPGADSITRESYSHKVISHGWWPGGGPFEDAAFYAYAAPEPAGYRDTPVQPSAAFYVQEFSEFVLPYEAVRAARSPEDELRAFLRSTYDSAAQLAGWNRAELERVAPS